MPARLRGWAVGLALFGGLSVALAQPAAPVFTEGERALIRGMGPWPAEPPADAGNELSGLAWAERLGEQLFNDTDLSGDRQLSCASCHIESLGFADSRAVAIGAGQHLRNTQSLLNVGLQRWFGWDGGSDSLWAAAMRPILSDVEMAGDIETIAQRLRDKGYFTQALTAAGRDQPVDDEGLVVIAAKSIAAYTRVLISASTPFDRFRKSLLDGDRSNLAGYSPAAQRGLKIFIGAANCHVCHFGANFSNREFHDIGRPFFTAIGQVDSGRYSGIQRVRLDRYNLLGPFNGTGVTEEIRKTSSVKLGQLNFGQWRTPSLRNLISTAPYMHDGTMATLRDVVDAYADIDPDRLHTNGEAILKPLTLSDAERNDLVAFLRSLSVE